MNVPVLVPLELRQLETEADFCDDNNCLSCRLLRQLIAVIHTKDREIAELRAELRDATDNLVEVLANNGRGDHHTYLPWSSAYQPLAS